MSTRWRFILSGRVQHVGLRYRAKLGADQLQLTGWIRNLENDEVEFEVQGEQYNIDSFLAYLHDLPYVRYTVLHAEEKEPIAETQFRIRYS